MINKFDESTSHTHPTMWKFVIILNCLFRVIEKKEKQKEHAVDTGGMSEM